MTERWIDAHSVTCVLCGGLADERRTQKINSDQLTPALRNEEPEVAHTIEMIIEANGEGEAHIECFEYVLDAEADPSGVDLEPRDHR